MKYLYGASVQGIQEFIFKTNKLKEIVGASELVEQITTTEIDGLLPDDSARYVIIVRAAGNIRIVFDHEEDIRNIVKSFPKKVMDKASGITLSQTVVTFRGEINRQAFQELELKLKTARNRPLPPPSLSLNIMRLAPRTAMPAVEGDLDLASLQKQEALATSLLADKMDLSTERTFIEIGKLSNAGNKIAVIHADGNGLGQLLQEKGENLEWLKTFSAELDTATKTAAKEAYSETPDMKVRPVILGGDDLTIICDADSALAFTHTFLEAFEAETERAFGREGRLTACAGIAYCNEKFPFHYAVTLAEALCTRAKTVSKALGSELAPSSLMFHSIHSTVFESFQRTRREELTLGDVDADFGPYFLNPQYGPSIHHLCQLVSALRAEEAPKSSLRRWLGALGRDEALARQMLERINEVAEGKPGFSVGAFNNNIGRLDPALRLDNLIVIRDSRRVTPVYDALQIISVSEEQA